MNDKITAFANKIFASKIWYYIQNILVVGLFMYCIKGLTDYDNVLYQTRKNQAAAKGLFAFMAIVFIVRKVKLINWQSLVATLLFVPFLIERMTFWKESPDIINILKPQMAAEWLALMIIIDMIVYKNVNDLFKGVNYLLIVYALLTFGMLYRRNGRMDPVILVFPMFLFALVKMDEEKWEWFLKRFIDSWFLMFVYAVVRSFRETPFNYRRFYGYFLNIGPFGVFMTCAFVAAIFAIIYSREKYGRKSFFYIVSAVWIAVCSYMLWIIDTRTVLAGAAFALIFLFLFGRKDTSKPKMRKRLIILGGIFATGIIVTAVILILAQNESSVYWYAKAEGSILAPLAMMISRFAGALKSSQGANGWETFVNIVDHLSSGRIEIAKGYSEFFNYEGNGAVGYELPSGYWVYNAHCNYVQILIEYGYFTLIETLVFVLMSFVISIKRYFKSGKKVIYFMPVLWLAAMLGVWLGEVNSLYYPVTFFGFMFMVRLFVPDDLKETAKIEVK